MNFFRQCSAALKAKHSRNTVCVNGRTIHISGNDISIVGGKIFVDGKEHKAAGDTENCITTVVIDGNVGTLHLDCGDVEVRGDSLTIDAHMGNVKVGGNVTGNVKSHMGNVDVTGNVLGSVSTKMGDIKHNKGKV